MTESESGSPEAKRAAYDKDQAFDIIEGMTVVGPNGEAIGVIDAVMGFGATRVGETPSGYDGRVTEARSSTGYITIKGSGGAGGVSGQTVIPFSEIVSVQAQVVTVKSIPRSAPARVAPSAPQPNTPWWRRIFGSKS
jgi:ribosomal 30S subunit maturation factor RimM